MCAISLLRRAFCQNARRENESVEMGAAHDQLKSDAHGWTRPSFFFFSPQIAFPVAPWKTSTRRENISHTHRFFFVLVLRWSVASVAFLS
jgi:hypothetical protein